MRRALASLLLCTACNTHVFSPPAGSFPIESAATVGAGRKSVGVDLAWASPVFGPSFSTYRASYRHGLGETLEVSAAPSMISRGRFRHVASALGLRPHQHIVLTQTVGHPVG